jgi:FtsX-like permease family
MLTDWRTLTDADPGLTPDRMNAQYDVGLRPGTDPTAYVQAVGARLGPYYGVSLHQHGRGAAIALAGTLTLLLSIAAGLGVLNTVVLQTRERVHDLGVFKTVGMTPSQTFAMVLCSVAGTGLLAGVLAVPAGIAVHRYVIPAMTGAAGLDVPASLQNVYGAGELAALALAGPPLPSPAHCSQPAGPRSHGRPRRYEPSSGGGGAAAGRGEPRVVPDDKSPTPPGSAPPARRDDLAPDPIAPSVTPETCSATSPRIPRVPATPFPCARNARAKPRPARCPLGRESDSKHRLLTEPSAASSRDAGRIRSALLLPMEAALSRDRSSSSFAPVSPLSPDPAGRICSVEVGGDHDCVARAGGAAVPCRRARRQPQVTRSRSGSRAWAASVSAVSSSAARVPARSTRKQSKLVQDLSQVRPRIAWCETSVSPAGRAPRGQFHRCRSNRRLWELCCFPEPTYISCRGLREPVADYDTVTLRTQARASRRMQRDPVVSSRPHSARATGAL